MGKADIVIVGAGPAGIAAACAAAEAGARVRVIDDNPAGGGQIWRAGRKGAASRRAGHWMARFKQCGAELMAATQVVAAVKPGVLLVESRGSVAEMAFEKLILSTGARELFLPFPGWTLPGVMGVGGLQALAKGGMPIAGKRVVIAGSGPLLLVAAHLRAEGAKVVLIAEQRGSLLRFGLGLLGSPRKGVQAIGLKMKLMGVPYRTTSWVTEAEPCGEGLRVTVGRGGNPERVDCDFLAYSFGLVANVELPAALGCVLTADGLVQVDGQQRTSVAGVYAAGEITGIGGVDKSLAEGLVAGTAAAGGDPAALLAKRDAAARFVARLSATFALREEVKRLATPETIVCRCEDVRLGQLEGWSSAREAKLQTRCGMGACQGRVCGPILRHLKGWTDASVRPPIFAAPAKALLPMADEGEAGARVAAKAD